MSSLSSQLKETATWKTIFHGQCAFRTSNAQSGTLRCKHLFTNTAQCHFVGCPIVQTNYVAIQRSFDSIYLVTKNQASKISEVWSDQELPADKDEALKVVQQATAKLNPVLKEAVESKFDHLYNVASIIRASEVDAEEEEDLEL